MLWTWPVAAPDMQRGVTTPIHQGFTCLVPACNSRPGSLGCVCHCLPLRNKFRRQGLTLLFLGRVPLGREVGVPGVPVGGLTPLEPAGWPGGGLRRVAGARHHPRALQGHVIIRRLAARVHRRFGELGQGPVARRCRGRVPEPAVLPHWTNGEENWVSAGGQGGDEERKGSTESHTDEIFGGARGCR